MDSLRELFIEQLQDAYNAEKQIIKALPRMMKEASSEELRSAFENHLEQTRGHSDQHPRKVESRHRRWSFRHTWSECIRSKRDRG